MPPPAAPPLVDGDPARLGPYRLLGRLGHGASGIVYLGERRGRLAVLNLNELQLFQATFDNYALWLAP